MLQIRKFRRDWAAMPVHWLPDDVLANHVINVLHLVLPPGELWMCRLFNRALPLVKHAELADQIRGMLGQEAAHASGHRDVLQYYEEHGFDLRPSQMRLNTLFTQSLGDKFLGRYHLSEAAERRWLLARLGIVTALEHLTCALGSWAFYNRELEKSCVFPDMISLIKWHAAEEMEHRCVAFDLYHHMGGGYTQRVLLYVLVFAVIVLTWKRGTKAFLSQDLKVERRYFLWDYMASSRRGHVPSVSYILRAFLRYLRPGFHPQGEASTEVVEAYLKDIDADSRSVADPQ